MRRPVGAILRGAAVLVERGDGLSLLAAAQSCMAIARDELALKTVRRTIRERRRCRRDLGPNVLRYRPRPEVARA
jgi:hypothetical protein